MIGYIIRRLRSRVIVTIGIAAISFAAAPLPAAEPGVRGARDQGAAGRDRRWNKQHGYDRPEIDAVL